MIALTRKHQLRHVQGLRAIAVIGVVAYHAGLPLPGGFTGVDVFFVISGFVICAMLLRQFESAGQVSLKQFYARRVRRLLPALVVMLSIVALASAALQSPIGTILGQTMTARTGLGATLLSANVVLYQVPVAGYFAARAHNNPLLHTWSLSVEEQFYLVLPALFIATMVIARRRRWRPTCPATSSMQLA